MTIHPCQRGKNRWLLGRNRAQIDGATQFGDRGRRKFKFDGFWSGQIWVRGTRLAAEFASEEEAFQYLEANLERMEASPMRNVKLRTKSTKPLIAVRRHPRSPLPLFVPGDTPSGEASR